MNNLTPAEVVGAYFQNLADGNVEQAMSALDPNIEWHQPGENRFAGVHRGPEAVGALIGGMMEVSQGTFAVAPAGPLMTNGDVVAAPVRFTGRRDGEVLDQDGIDLLTVTDGRISQVRLFSSDGPAEDRFWGQS
ncbi:nuclear transport factor 2 family protein [Micrococcus porci]|uniref:nuclear transport factor 2 family protein n=1 Tax=Micrococcus TaxID=1269 RepID=UPI001CC8F6BE|nr:MULTISPECIES: nuclear transport factor 2 family protein [Micrococcus]MCG7422845.1 nuclear transport factor 2 family protein [Micrococcus sp. ACRRV]UBH24759.1 nuclear transport factor 2 family protein [Micrococcus porci]